MSTQGQKEKLFKQICEVLFSELKADEYLTLSFDGENSQFVRVNNAKVRQTGIVSDADISYELISNQRVCHGSVTIKEPYESFEKDALAELKRLRSEVGQLPEDPYIVLPENAGSSREVRSANLLDTSSGIDSLLPVMQGVDLVGIYASGNIFRGNANSKGQRHWFETDTFSFDYSIVAPDHKMVKGTYAGTDWNQAEYEMNVQDSKKKLDLMNLPVKKLKPGHYRTWFAPSAVADLLGMFNWNGISEASIQQGNSAFLKMRNEGVTLSSKFNLSEDFTNGMVPRFNEKGQIAPKCTPVFQNGKLVNTLVSSRSEKEYKKKSNYASSGEYMRSPIMGVGSLSENKVLNKLCTGLYLSNLHYLNWSDNIGGRVTGLTRYACFWVEDGKIVAPIETMRFDDTLYRYFGTELEEVGKESCFIPEVETYDGRQLGGTSCPGILVKSFELTL